MSTRVEKDFVFAAGVHFEGKFMINVYDLSLSMLVETDSIREQNIAMDRIQYFLSAHVDDSVFVDSRDKEAVEKYEKADLKVLGIPEEPYDQVVGMILMLKLNSILEGRMSITDIKFGSKMGVGIKFHTVIEEAKDLFSGKNWWNSSSTNVHNLTRDSKKKEKIVNLFDRNDWSSLGLDWKERVKES